MQTGAKKKKGLSMEEKCEKVGTWLASHPYPYTLKELTSLVPKATGVIWQSIEECLELLVAENRICADRVGVHTLFWCFPRTAAQVARAEAGGAGAPNASASTARKSFADHLATLSIAELREERDRQQAAHAALEVRLAARRAEVGDAAEAARDAREMQSLQAVRLQRVAQRQRLAAYDPRLLASLEEGARTALEAGNRWTNNYFLLEQHATARLGQSARELRAALGVPECLDFVETWELRRGERRDSVDPPLMITRASALTDEAPVGEDAHVGAALDVAAPSAYKERDRGAAMVTGEAEKAVAAGQHEAAEAAGPTPLVVEPLVGVVADTGAPLTPPVLGSTHGLRRARGAAAEKRRREPSVAATEAAPSAGTPSEANEEERQRAGVEEEASPDAAATTTRRTRTGSAVAKSGGRKRCGRQSKRVAQ